jgi:GAF domain-containing protein
MSGSRRDRANRTGMLCRAHGRVQRMTPSGERWHWSTVGRRVAGGAPRGCSAIDGRPPVGGRRHRVRKAHRAARGCGLFPGIVHACLPLRAEQVVAPLSDQDLLLDVLTRFSRTLAGRYDVSDVLYELSDGVARVLNAVGAGVSLADDDGQLRFATATNEVVTAVEQVQQDSQQGPCHVAYTANQPVLVPDLRQPTAWPQLSDAALGAGLASVAWIPMTFDGRAVGSLDIYDDHVREWSDQDVAAALVLADIATGYLVHASELNRARRVNEQLQAALDSRVVIEQAKGLLAGERGITLDQAFALLRSHARNRNAPIHAIAQAVVELGFRP